MTDFVRTGQVTAGTTPSEFPHRCPHCFGGASQERCKELTADYQKNLRGCGGAHEFGPCNSKERKCIQCLADGLRGNQVELVSDIDRGLCERHIELALRPKPATQPVRRRVPEFDLDKGLTSGLTAVFRRPVEQPAVPRARGAVTETKVVKQKVVEPSSKSTLAVVLESSKKKATAENNASCDTTVKKGRTTTDAKLLSMSEIAAAAGDPRNLRATDLIEASAKQLNTAKTAVRTCWARLSDAQRKFLLYGERGKKKTRSEEKFAILLRIRNEMRDAGKPAPTKKELAEAASEPLGMTQFSTNTYIYDRLTADQVKKLEFGLPPNVTGLTLDEQYSILKRIREEMRTKGLPAPRQIDLADAAARELKQLSSSVRSLITGLSKERRDELDFFGSRSRLLVGIEPAVIREGFLGAISVLKLRKRELTVHNLRDVLKLKPSAIRAYLKEQPDIAKLLKG